MDPKLGNVDFTLFSVRIWEDNATDTNIFNLSDFLDDNTVNVDGQNEQNCTEQSSSKKKVKLF